MFPDRNHKNRSIWRNYLPHTRYILESDLADRNQQSRINLIRKYGACLYEDGRWNEAEAAIKEVLEIEKRNLGMDHPDTLTSMSNLASTYRKQGRWKEAEGLEMQAIEMRKRVFAAAHPVMLINMANLASTFWSLGRWKEAEELELQVMETSLRVFDIDHPFTLVSMSNLASTYRNQGR